MVLYGIRGGAACGANCAGVKQCTMSSALITHLHVSDLGLVASVHCGVSRQANAQPSFVLPMTQQSDRVSTILFHRQSRGHSLGVYLRISKITGICGVTARRDNRVHDIQRGELLNPIIPSLSSTELTLKTKRRRTSPSHILAGIYTIHRGSKTWELLDPCPNLPQWLNINATVVRS
jgi:hypothetical protein